MANKGIGVGNCPIHREYFLDAEDSPYPSCEDEFDEPTVQEVQGAIERILRTYAKPRSYNRNG